MTSMPDSMPNGSPRLELYGEPHLQALPGPYPPGMPALLADLLAAPSATDREVLVQSRLRQIGAQWLLHAKVMQTPGEPPALVAFSAYAPDTWAKHYVAAGPSGPEAGWASEASSGLPYIWDLHEPDLLPSPPGPTARRVMAALRASGAHSGMVFRVPAWRLPNDQCFVFLAAPEPQRGWIDEPTLGQALALSLCLHEFLTRYVRAAEPRRTEDTLPFAQQHILLCLSQGWTNKEIARKLRLSLHAVDYHLRQLRSRFAVHNRTQLVRAAMATGLGERVAVAWP